MKQPRLLDAFSGAGGCAMGYHRAGFDVVGVDISRQPRYPFEFHQGDAIEFIAKHGHEFDVIHASPPCQAYSAARTIRKRQHPDLIAPTRAAILATGRPYVIENVPGAPLLQPAQLCATTLPGAGIVCRDGVRRELRRHRLFESSLPLVGTECRHTAPSFAVFGGGPRRTRKPGGSSYQGPVAESRAVMGIDWMTRDELSQAIPPVYTQHIGCQLATFEHRMLSAEVAS